MNNITLSISSAILELIQKKYYGDYSNIKEIKLFWHNYNYLPLFQHSIPLGERIFCSVSESAIACGDAPSRKLS